MISQKITYHPNTYIIHEFFEYDEDQLILYEKYDLNEQLEYRKSQDVEFNFLNGKRHGTQKSWYLCSRKLAYEHNYINGQAHGSFKEWHPNGQLNTECHRLNGERHGLYKRWYPNGQLAYEHNYINGKEHGIQKGWFEDGKLEYEDKYINGELQW